jgi:hypothetical protein
MPQWEFIEIVRLSDEVYVVPPGKIDLRWLTQRFPTSRIDGHKNRVLDKVSFPSMREAGDCYSAVIAYAGSQGWQTFAAEQTRSQFVSFRRSSPAY